MRYPFILISGISLLSLCAFPLCAETQRNNQHPQAVIPADKVQPKQPVTKMRSKPTIIPIIYQPTSRGKPDMTRIVSAGTRGKLQNFVYIAVLAPEHTGLSSTESPTLYWFISKTVERPLELTITDRQSVTPILETQLNNPANAGIQSIKLSNYSLRLQPEVKYQWCIRMINHSKKEAQNLDVVSYGSILYRKASTELSRQWQQASSGALPALYAEKDYWYDALTAISSLVGKHPENQAVYEQRTSLLEQVQLDEVMAQLNTTQLSIKAGDDQNAPNF